MIIAKLIGGLGNQMFQYAIARKISYLKNVNLKIDKSYFTEQNNDTPRNYSLGVFNIKEDFVSDLEIKKFIKNNFIEKLKPYHKRAIVKEKNFYFDSKILTISDNAYLQGYWQSEKYFSDIRDIIVQDFSLRIPLGKKAQEFIQKINNSNSVSLHFRRGDYVSNKQTNQFHGVCDLNYYYQAIEKTKSNIANPIFFIFSDDIKWVKENLKINSPTFFVSNNKEIKDYEELILMSNCRHNIIANSSFSWWGAWLNQNPNKIVIAPKKWFNTNISTNDLMPESWLRI